MKQSFKEYVASRFNEILKAETDPVVGHDIVVLLGVNDFIDISQYSDRIVDIATFSVDGNASVFNEE